MGCIYYSLAVKFHLNHVDMHTHSYIFSTQITLGVKGIMGVANPFRNGWLILNWVVVLLCVSWISCYCWWWWMCVLSNKGYTAPIIEPSLGLGGGRCTYNACTYIGLICISSSSNLAAKDNSMTHYLHVYIVTPVCCYSFYWLLLQSKVCFSVLTRLYQYQSFNYHETVMKKTGVEHH